jgi:hypothetical protein
MAEPLYALDSARKLISSFKTSMPELPCTGCRPFFKAGKLTVGDSTMAEALDSLIDGKLLVQLDSIFKGGGNMLIVMPMNPHSESADAIRLAGADGGATEHLPSPPKISWMMYPWWVYAKATARRERCCTVHWIIVTDSVRQRPVD